MDIGIFKKLHAAQLKCRVKLFALILSYLEVATHYLPLYQILLFQQILTYPICPLHVVSIQRPGGGWSHICSKWRESGHFNTQPPEGGWQDPAKQERLRQVSTHSRPKAAGATDRLKAQYAQVSTHSRPKAAGRTGAGRHPAQRGFNTQPPEGGWAATPAACGCHQAVSTHSRPKAAGGLRPAATPANSFQHTAARRRLEVVYLFPSHPTSCFNTQPPEGGWGQLGYARHGDIVSTHSRPKAAGRALPPHHPQQPVSTHSRPKAAGRPPCFITVIVVVSTHSRPKAAGRGKR